MKTKLRSYLGLENEIEYGINYRNTSPNTNLQKAYLTALAKERQNLYKTTAYSKNEGIRVFDEPSAALNFSGDRFKAEITIKVQTPDPIVPTANVLVGGASSGAQISTSQQSTQTVKVYAKDLLPSVGGAITIDNSANIKILSIKYVYK